MITICLRSVQVHRQFPRKYVKSRHNAYILDFQKGLLIVTLFTALFSYGLPKGKLRKMGGGFMHRLRQFKWMRLPLPTELLKFKSDFSASHELTFTRSDRTWKLDGRPLDRKYSVRVVTTHHNYLSELNTIEKLNEYCIIFYFTLCWMAKPSLQS